MTERVFVDTNVLIYARDKRDAAKRAKAASWLLELGRSQAACINLQVLNELTGWILRNERARSIITIQEEIETLSAWGNRPISNDEVESAWQVRQRLGYQWFDCLLIASALNAGCRYFLTEDMAHGAIFEGLRLINPFQASPGDVIQRT